MPKPKYADGITEAKCGDVVRCVSDNLHRLKLGQQVTVSGIEADIWVRIKENHGDTCHPSHLELIRRQEEMMPESPDMINHPPHYADLRPEPIDVIEAWQLEFHEANALKYIARAPRKGCQVKDLRKAAWYLTRKAELLERSK